MVVTADPALDLHARHWVELPKELSIFGARHRFNSI